MTWLRSSILHIFTLLARNLTGGTSLRIQYFASILSRLSLWYSLTIPTQDYLRAMSSNRLHLGCPPPLMQGRSGLGIYLYSSHTLAQMSLCSVANFHSIHILYPTAISPFFQVQSLWIQRLFLYGISLSFCPMALLHI